MHVCSCYPALLAVLLGVASLATSQDDVNARLKAVEERLNRTEEENAALRRELEALRGTPPSPASPAELEAAIERALERRHEEQPAFWKQLTRSGSPIQFYGFLRLDAYYNSARANHVIVPSWVLSENGVMAKKNDDTFALDARLTRLGLNVKVGEVAGANATGKVEIDFANFTGGPESRAAPRIRLGYLDLDFGDVALRFGQDWDVISPYYPTANTENLMWNAGNLGDRRPQARVTYETDLADETGLLLQGALGLTGAIDNQDLDAPPPSGVSSERDGFDSGLPHVQLRGAVKTASVTFGVWGHLAALETDTSFGPGRGSKHFRGSSVGVDWLIPIGDPVSIKGEAWTGQALGDVRGGIAQSINTTLGEEIRSTGGWTEVAVQATDGFRVALGGSIDDPNNRDLGSGARKKNYTIFVATGHDWGGGFKTGFDVIYWATHYVDQRSGTMVRFNVYTQLDF